MSLDVWLKLDQENPRAPKPAKGSGIFVRRNGSTQQISLEEYQQMYPGLNPVTISEESSDGESDGEIVVYEGNITHNLIDMAKFAGLYEATWHPEMLFEGNILASQISPYLACGLRKLVINSDKAKAFASPNGWGTYEQMLIFVSEYLEACCLYPEAFVNTWT
jgi:hypothetical protein